MFNYLKSLNTNQKSFAIAATAHVAILFFMFFKLESSAVPIVSFSVTMADQVSVSQNNISATTIAATQKSEKKEKTEETKNDNSNKKIVKKQDQDTPEVKAKNGTDVSSSKQQNAVVGNDTPAVFDAAYLNNPSPTYPPSSKKAGEQGKVLLDVYVTNKGTVEKITVNKSSGFTKLDNAALNTVKKWRFVPAKKGGQVEASQVQVPIDFVLNEAK